MDNIPSSGQVPEQPQKVYNLVQPAPTTQSSPAVPVLQQASVPAMGSAAPKTAGGLGLKSILVIVAVLAVFGIAAAGYFAAPQTFYDIVGKYVGMSAPAVTTPVNDGDMLLGVPLAETGTTTQADIPTADLISALPGSDANLIIHFKTTPELTAATDTSKMVLAEQFIGGDDVNSKYIEEKYSELFQSFSEVVIAMKLDYKTFAPTGTSTKISVPLAIAVEPTSGKEQLVRDAITNLASPTLQTNLKINQLENGTIVATDENAPLQGKLADNSLAADISNSPENMAVVIDAKQLVSDLANDPNPMLPPAQLDLVKKVQSLAVFVSAVQNIGKYNLVMTVSAGMSDDLAATALFAMLKPDFDKSKLLVPTVYNAFLETSFDQTLNKLNLQISIKDLVGLTDKLSQAAKEAEQVEQEKLKNLFEEESKKLDEVQQNLDDLAKREAEARAAGKILRPKTN